MEGTAFSMFGPIPRYNPKNPSAETVFRRQSIIPVNFGKPSVILSACRRVLTNCKGYATT